MAYSEADTRAKLIDPAIHKRGWTEDLVRREEAVGSIDIIGKKARRRAKASCPVRSLGGTGDSTRKP